MRWFLLIICKDLTLNVPTNLLSRNYPTLCFLLTTGGQANFLCSSLTFTTQQVNACSSGKPCYVCLKSKMLCIHLFSPSSSSPWLLGNIGEFRAKSYFTDHQTANTIQLFVVKKRYFSGQFIFWASCSKGEFFTCCLINVTTCLLAYH